MNVNWKILKKRGNHRPVLKYEIELEEFEVDLAVPQVLLEAAIPKPPSAWRSYCYPGEDERGGVSLEWYRLMTPSHKQKRVEASLTLAWRGPDNDYLDVQAAFEQLRHDFEVMLRQAYDYAPLDLVDSLELTDETRKHIVCGVAKAKILSAVGF